MSKLEKSNECRLLFRLHFEPDLFENLTINQFIGQQLCGCDRSELFLKFRLI